MLPDQHRRNESAAIDQAHRYEQSQGRQAVSTASGQYPDDVLTQVLIWGSEAGLGCRRSLSSSLVSYGPGGAVERLIEVKGCAGQSTGISVADRQLATAQQLRGHYWLYVVFGPATPSSFLVVVDDAAALPWRALDHALPDSVAQPASAGAEQRWHVLPGNVLAAGERILLGS